MNDALRAFAYDWRFSLAIALCGFAFVGGLTVLSLVRQNKRAYLPSLLLIDIDLGIVNSIVRNLFFFHLSPHPTKLGGFWRLVSGSALLIVGGFILFLRVWMGEQAKKRVPAEDR